MPRLKYDTLFNRAARFLQNLEGKICIFHDDDADGVCGAAVVLAFLDQSGKSAKNFCGDIDEKNFKKYAKEKCDVAIFIDYPLADYPQFLEFFKGKKILILDHHIPTNEINSKEIIYLNPRFKKKDLYYCSTHLAWDVCTAAGLKGFEWLMRLGSVGDHEIEGIDEEREAIDVVHAIQAMKKESGMQKLASDLSEFSKLSDFVYNPNYQKMKNILKKEIDRQVNLFDLQTPAQGIHFFEIKSNYSITSILANTLFDLYPSRTIILCTKKNGGWNVSARSRKFDLNAAFKIASKGIGSGGGHPVAAGARVSDFKIFRKRLLEVLK